MTFQGFGTPEQNWSKLPHTLIAALPTIKSASELKVILYILRHTWGFHETEKRISLDEFANGRKKRGGERLDGGTGMSIPAIRNGIKRATEHGFISVETDDSDKARVKKYYSLNQTARKLQSGCKNVIPRVKESCNRTKKETIETNQERHVATATRAPANIACHECKRPGFTADEMNNDMCPECYGEMVDGAKRENEVFDAVGETQPLGSIGALIDQRERQNCRDCGESEVVETMVDEMCQECFAEFIEERRYKPEEPPNLVPPKPFFDGGPDGYLPPVPSGDEPCTCGNDGLCGNCGKPTATTADMPDVHNVCICKQEAALVEDFGERPERPKREPPPHWKQASQEPWATWGAQSDEFQRGLRQYREAGRSVQLLGYEWEKLTQLAPDWTNKKEVKSWSSGLWACLKATGGDASIVLSATRKAIQDGLTISKPYSVVEVSRALCAERKRGPLPSSGMAAGIVYA